MARMMPCPRRSVTDWWILGVPLLERESIDRTMAPVVTTLQRNKLIASVF